MANPLRWFRRHQKLMMVFFGVGLMAVFGLGSVFTMINPGQMSVERENPVIATWKGGKITRNDLDVLRARHFQTMRFLDGLTETAAKIKGDSFQPVAIPISRVAQAGDFNQEEVDRRLLDKFLMAELAKEEGIVVNEFMVDEYLAQVRGYVPMSRNDMAEINREVNQGASAMEMIRRHLQFELAAQLMNNLVSVSISGANPRMPRVPNPLDAIDLYTKSNRRIECQVLKVDVDPETVAESPSESEIRKIFDQGKYSYPQIDLSKPGFKIGKKVRVQSFKANRDNFLQNEINKLTDAEVQAEYERLVAEENPMVMELVPDEVPPASVDPDNSNSNDPAPTEADMKQQDADAAPQTVDESSDENPPPAEEKSSGTDSKKKGEDKNADGGEEKESGNTDDNSPDGDGSVKEDGAPLSMTPRAEQFVSTSVYQEPDGTDAKVQENEPDSGEESAEAGEKAQQESEPDKAGEAATPQAQPAAETANAAEKLSDAAAETANEGEPKAAAQNDQPETTKTAPVPESSEDTAQGEQKSEPVLPGLADEPAKPKQRPKALVDCAQAIKESMKRLDATNAMKDALDRAENEIGAFRNRFTRWKFNDDEATRGEEPIPPDFNGIASKYNLEFSETGLVDINELMQEEIGKVQVFRQVMGRDGRPQPYFASLAELIFNSFADSNEYDPARESDMTATYSFWLAEKADARIPELKEVKDKVILYWKQQKALEAAMADAESIAREINDSNQQTLVGKFPEKAVSTGEFTWFSMAGGEPRISSPNGTTDVGQEFMKTAFSLAQYKAGAAPNLPRDSVYVIQLLSAKTPLADMGTEYLKDRFFKFKTIPTDVRNISMWYTIDLYRDWNAEFAEGMDLELVGQ